MQIADHLLDELSEIGRKYLIEKIVLFGSRARGDSNPWSDIDLAIYPLEGFN